jgi:Ubiquitin-2 like Rad60 SUMO-like
VFVRPDHLLWHVILTFYRTNGIPPYKQNWLYDGEWVPPEATLESQDLGDEDILDLTIRQYGGGGVESRDCKKADMVGRDRPFTLAALRQLLQEFVNGKEMTEKVSHMIATLTERT